MNGYQLLGRLVWRAAKWYLRRRLPSRGTLAAGGLAAAVGLVAAAVLVRRVAA